MTKAHRLTPRKRVLSQDVPAVPVNFLLGCSDSELDAYELARLAAIADLRTQLHELYDKLIEQQALAGLVRWFRGQDRETLKYAIENTESPMDWRKEKSEKASGARKNYSRGHPYRPEPRTLPLRSDTPNETYPLAYAASAQSHWRITQ